MIDLDETLAQGGTRRLDLLRHSVMSITIEPLFLFLASEYRLRPSDAAALALFDVFCAIGAPARLAAYELLPPRELRLAAAVSTIRVRGVPVQCAEDEGSLRTVAAGASRTVFDPLVRGLRADARGTLKALSASYDPDLNAEENLPGGRMSASQRQFVERVWQPIVRPRLTAAGFWQVATVG